MGRVEAVKEEHEPELLEVEGVVSVAVAETDTGEPSLRVGLREGADTDAVPDTIDGIPVVVADTGRPELWGTDNLGPRPPEADDDAVADEGGWQQALAVYMRWVLPVLATILVVFTVADSRVGAVGIALATLALAVTLLLRQTPLAE